MSYKIFTVSRYELYWNGEIKEDGTEELGRVVATSKTLEGIRKYARLKKITDWDHTIHEIGPGEYLFGAVREDVVAEHTIKTDGPLYR